MQALEQTVIMTKKNRRITPADGRFFHDIANQLKLILRLLADRRVHPLIKLLPIGSLVYLVFPDFLPLNPIDDAVVIGLGTYMFVELCPPEVVQEHKEALKNVVAGTWRDPDSNQPAEDKSNIIEGEFHEK
jgi:hypothetical protein